MPPKIMGISPQQRTTPCFGVDLDNVISPIREQMAWVIALPLLQHI